MKKDSLIVFLKVFVRLFSIFAYLGSTMWTCFILSKLGLPKSVLEFAMPLIAIGHLALLAALWKELSGSKEQ